MRQEIKFPNKYNQCASFCKAADCDLFGECIFGFNKTFLGARELRLDFNQCNLQCELCWSNNEDSSKMLSAEAVFDNFVTCVSANHRYIYQIKNPVKKDTFKLQSFQIIGGEPLLSLERFQFIRELISKIDSLFIKNFGFYSDSMKLDSKNRFRIKLFTNGITIGNETISISEINKLNQFKHIKIDLLVSIKGLNEEGFLSLQKVSAKDESDFEYQIACLEKLLEQTYDNLYIQPVLGFYHSKVFNIKAPGVDANDMFIFKETALSKKLYDVLKTYISKGYKFYVEPIHALGKGEKEVQKFYAAKASYLERSNLIEADLKSNSKTDYRKTKLKCHFL